MSKTDINEVLDQKTIEITQDGIGRIDRANSPEDIVALHTSGIETCFVFYIASAKGVSLIHATHMLDMDKLSEEFLWHEEILYWSMVTNQDHYSTREDAIKFHNTFSRYQDLQDRFGTNGMRRMSDGKMDIIFSNSGFVTLTRQGHIEVEALPDKLVPTPLRETRININWVNNYFLSDDERIAPDFQFDGMDYTPLPTLLKTLGEVLSLCVTDPKFGLHSDLTRTGLATYQECAAALKLIEALDITDDVAELNAAYLFAPAADVLGQAITTAGPDDDSSHTSGSDCDDDPTQQSGL